MKNYRQLFIRPVFSALFMFALIFLLVPDIAGAGPSGSQYVEIEWGNWEDSNSTIYLATGVISSEPQQVVFNLVDVNDNEVLPIQLDLDLWLFECPRFVLGPCSWNARLNTTSIPPGTYYLQIVAGFPGGLGEVEDIHSGPGTYPACSSQGVCIPSN